MTMLAARRFSDLTCLLRSRVAGIWRTTQRYTGSVRRPGGMVCDDLAAWAASGLRRLQKSTCEDVQRTLHHFDHKLMIYRGRSPTILWDKYIQIFCGLIPWILGWASPNLVQFCIEVLQLVVTLRTICWPSWPLCLWNLDLWGVPHLSWLEGKGTNGIQCLNLKKVFWPLGLLRRSVWSISMHRKNVFLLCVFCRYFFSQPCWLKIESIIYLHP